jgi:valyl-tRNA synthetase
MNLGGETPASLGEPDPAALQLADRWILSRLARVNRETAERYGSYGLGEAAKGLYEFAWNEVCDWYVELIKRRLQVPADLEGAAREAALADQRTARQVLAKVLQELLVMLHPLMPHITEELWHGLLGLHEDSPITQEKMEVLFADRSRFLALQAWPEVCTSALDDAIENSFNRVIEAIRLARNLRAVAGLKPSQQAPIQIVIDSEGVASVLRDASSDISTLAKASDITICLTDQFSSGSRCLAGVSGTLQVLLPVAGLVDLDALRSRLEKDIAKAEKEIQGLSGRLANPNFSIKAPPEVVAECRANLAEAEAQAELARRRLADLG